MRDHRQGPRSLGPKGYERSPDRVMTKDVWVRSDYNSYLYRGLSLSPESPKEE